MDLWSQIIAGIGGAGGMAALAKVLWDSYRASRKEKGEEARTDTEFISRQYRELSERLQTRIDALSIDLRKLQQEKDEEVNALRERERKLSVENEQLRGELRMLQLAVTRIRTAGDYTLAQQEMSGIVVCDQDMRIVEWNPAATRMFHWTAREVLGKPVTMLLPPAWRERHTAAVEAMRKAGRPPDAQARHFPGLTREGAEIPLEVTMGGWYTAGRWTYYAELKRDWDADAGKPDGDGATTKEARNDAQPV